MALKLAAPSTTAYLFLVKLHRYPAFMAEFRGDE